MQMRRRHFEQLARFQGGRQGRSIIQIVGHRLSGRRSERCELQDQRPATRAEHRGDPGQMQPRARLNERVPRRVLEGEFRGRRMLAVIDDAARPRLGSGLVEHQAEARVRDPAHPARVDPVPPSLAVDDAAERSFRQPRDPGDPAAEPSEEAADIQLAAADPDLEETRLVEPLLARAATGASAFRRGSGDRSATPPTGSSARSAGDIDDLAGDERGVIAGQEGDDIGDVARFGHAHTPSDL